MNTKKSSKKMFTKLFDFAFQRSTKQAFGFYFTYLVIGLIVTFALASVAGPSTLSGEELERLFIEAEQTGEVPLPLRAFQEEMLFFSSIVSLVFSSVLGFWIAYQKRIYEQYSVVFIVCGAALTGMFLGLIVSIGLVAWLTTKPTKEDSVKPETE